MKVVLCAAVSLFVLKLASDQQQARWRAKQMPQDTDPEIVVCPDVLSGPDMHLEWPDWKPYAELQSEEVALADKKNVSHRDFPLPA
jgi:hypothetical protein